jgi:hypothetical protein
MTEDDERTFGAALTEIPAADWAAAAVARHSTRTYFERAIEKGLLHALERFVGELPGAPSVRIEIIREVPQGLFTGYVGGYGRVIGAPSALMIIGNMNDPVVHEKAGYLGEAVILQATSLNIDTCWVAGFFNRDTAEGLLELDANERVLAISPLGHAQPRPRAGERFLKRVVGAHKRRPIEEVAPGFDEGKWPAWAAEGVRLARLAPSAVNRQPWSFQLAVETEAHARPAEATGIILSVVERGSEGHVSRRLDCGVAMLHFEVGARLMGATGSWEMRDHPEVARFLVSPGG